MGNSSVNEYFDVIIHGQTWLNLAFLMLTFPLGIIYFVVLITGLSVGLGLIILGVGLVILAAVFMFIWTVTVFERQLAISLLSVSIPTIQLPKTNSPRIWERIRVYLIDPVTWKSFLFMLLKFPLGIFSFVMSVTLLATSLGMTFAPIYYQENDMDFVFTEIDTIEKALLVSFIGIVLLPAALHILNLIAKAYGEVARVLLSPGEQHESSPVT